MTLLATLLAFGAFRTWPHYTRRLDDGRLRVVQPDHYQEFRDGKSYGYLEYAVTRTPAEWLIARADDVGKYSGDNQC